MKTLVFNSLTIQIQDPKLISFDNNFDEQLYSLIYGLLVSGSNYEPVLNTDDFQKGVYSLNLETLYNQSGLSIKPPGRKSGASRQIMESTPSKRLLITAPRFYGISL